MPKRKFVSPKYSANQDVVEAIATIFGRRADKRSADNLVQMLCCFYELGELTPYQVIKRLHLSSSIAYSMIRDLDPLYLEKVRDEPSKRGPFETNPVYKLTSNGILLSGFLLKKKQLIIEALKSGEGNPLYRLSVSLFDKIPPELIFKTAYQMLRLKNVSVEVFFDGLVGAYKAKLTQTQSEKIRTALELEYQTFAPYEKAIVLEYMREKLKHNYFMKLAGSDLENYHNETLKHPNKIVYKCGKCGKIMTTENPFETRITCSDCS